MNNNFDLKKFLAEGKLLKEENEANIADFLNQHKDEALEKIFGYLLNQSIEDEDISQEKVDNIDEQDKTWEFISKDNNPADPFDHARLANELPISYDAMVSFEPFPEDYDFEFSSPDETEIAGVKVYYFTYNY